METEGLGASLGVAEGRRRGGPWPRAGPFAAAPDAKAPWDGSLWLMVVARRRPPLQRAKEK